MAEKKSNAQRREDTRNALISSARTLFVEKGYAETGTPEIVKKAQVTRGALYHHFEDKADLFRAVIENESRLVGDEIAKETAEPDTVLGGLIDGCHAYFRVMADPGRSRLLLLEGPAILGNETMAEIDETSGRAEIERGLRYAKEFGQLGNVDIGALADLISAASERAALAQATGTDAQPYLDAMEYLMTSILSEPVPSTE